MEPRGKQSGSRLRNRSHRGRLWAREQGGGLYRFQEVNTKHLGQALGRRRMKEGKRPRVTVEGHVQDKMTGCVAGEEKQWIPR